MEVKTAGEISPTKRPAHARSRSAGVVLKSLVSPSKKDAHSPTKRSREAGFATSEAVTKTSLDLNSRRVQSKEVEDVFVKASSPHKNPARKVTSPSKPSKPEVSQSVSPRKQRPLSGFNAVFGKQKPLNASPTKGQTTKDKENQTPPQTATTEPHTPIWAEFTSDQWKKDLRPKQDAYDAVEQDHTSRAWNSQHIYGQPLKETKVSTGSPTKPIVPSPQRKKRSETSSTDKCNIKSDPSARRAQSAKISLQKPVDGFKVSGEGSGQSYIDSNSRPSSKDSSLLSSSSDASQTTSRVASAIAALSEAGGGGRTVSLLQGHELQEAFEAMLTTRNIPEPTRCAMRSLDVRVKNELIRQHTKPAPIPVADPPESSPKKSGSWNRRASPTKSPSKNRRKREADDAGPTTDDESCPSPSKRSRSRSRTWTLTKRDKSTTKRSRSGSRTRGLMSLKNFSSSSVNSMGYDGASDSKQCSSQNPRTKASLSTSGTLPSEYVDYLTTHTVLSSIEVGRLQRLRRLLRSETVAWVAEFIQLNGMDELIVLLQKIMALEWREEHEDLLLHETLRCLKSLGTTELALQKLDEAQPVLFPQLLKMLFDDERRGPSEFTTRGIIIELLYVHLSSAPISLREKRAGELLGYLQDPKKAESERPIGFVECMVRPRPYTNWCREITNTTKEVFWIFIHHENVIDIPSPTAQHTNTTPRDAEPNTSTTYTTRHFPPPRSAHPAAPHIGGPEHEATSYLSAHLDLLNGLIASLPSTAARNKLRVQLSDSGFEKVMGASLRTCKEKFYGCVHEGLRTWVGAAVEDGWDAEDVCRGRRRVVAGANAVGAPKLELPVLGGEERRAWL